MTEPDATIMNAESQPAGARRRVESELRQLRERLADAWWYEEPLEKIQELEVLIAARARDLAELR